MLLREPARRRGRHPRRPAADPGVDRVAAPAGPGQPDRQRRPGDPGHRPARASIRVEARRVIGRDGGPTVRIAIIDDGPGVPTEILDRLFLPFVTTKAPGEGTGLGLSVSFGIVAGHGGTLRHEPGPGGGATFVIELPVGRDEPAGRSRRDQRRRRREAAAAEDVAVAAATDGAGRPRQLGDRRRPAASASSSSTTSPRSATSSAGS